MVVRCWLGRPAERSRSVLHSFQWLPAPAPCRLCAGNKVCSMIPRQHKGTKRQRDRIDSYPCLGRQSTPWHRPYIQILICDPSLIRFSRRSISTATNSRSKRSGFDCDSFSFVAKPFDAPRKECYSKIWIKFLPTDHKPCNG